MSADGAGGFGERLGGRRLRRREATLASVGRALGVTGRAIRFYEERGLIRCGRDPLDHRILEPDMLQRLTRIVELRRLGLSLGEIGAVLDAKSDVAALLRQRLEALLVRLEDQRRAVVAYLGQAGAEPT